MTSESDPHSVIRHAIDDLAVFLAIARERSFTRAASQLGISQSTLSHAMRGLERRLGVRLLTRTTRSVACTEAGQHLYERLAPSMNAIDAELAAIRDYREMPAGRVRILASDYAARSLVWPRLARVLGQYPDVQVEVSSDYGLSKSGGLSESGPEAIDLDVRTGLHVARGQTAQRISPDFLQLLVASPDYLARATTLDTPDDLMEHDCLGLRIPYLDHIQPWALSCGDQEMAVQVQARLSFNSLYPICECALQGDGIGFLPEPMVHDALATGHLVQVLPAWAERVPGFHVSHSASSSPSRALQVVLDALLLEGEWDGLGYLT